MWFAPNSTSATRDVSKVLGGNSAEYPRTLTLGVTRLATVIWPLLTIPVGPMFGQTEVPVFGGMPEPLPADECLDSALLDVLLHSANGSTHGVRSEGAFDDLDDASARHLAVLLAQAESHRHREVQRGGVRHGPRRPRHRSHGNPRGLPPGVPADQDELGWRMSLTRASRSESRSPGRAEPVQALSVLVSDVRAMEYTAVIHELDSEHHQD